MARKIIIRKEIVISALALAALMTAVIGALSAAAYREQLFAVRSAPFNEAYYAAVSFAPEHTGGGEGRLWTEGVVEFTLNAPAAGDYWLSIEYAPRNKSFEQNLFDLTVNGVSGGVNTENIALPSFYRFNTYNFVKNSKDNDIYPEQIMIDARQRVTLRVGAQAYRNDRLAVSLRRGDNVLSLSMNEGAVVLYSLSLLPIEPLPSYAEYRAVHAADVMSDITVIEAEKFYYKNRSATSIVNSAEFTASPYSTLAVDLNVIDSKTYRQHGDALAYLLNIDKSGYYNIGIKTTMPGKTDSPVFIDIEIDGNIPFAEFAALELDYHREMHNHYFDEFPVYFDAGTHEISFFINGALYHTASDKLHIVADEINELSIAIRKITGNNQDKNRDWIIADYLPAMVSDMEHWRTLMLEVRDEILTLSGGVSTEETQKLGVALTQLQKLIAEPNKVPYRLTVLSEGEASILQTLSQALLTITSQALGVDQIIIGGDIHKLPVTKNNTFFAIAENATQLAASFQQKTAAAKTAATTIDVWILRSRQYVDVLQSLADERFTPETGVTVNFSLITDQGKLTLANAAGRQPDAALGVDRHYINDMALRGSLADLRAMNDANATIRNAAAGSLLQMIIDNKLYGVPESQDVYLLFYRKDIFSAFGWTIPDTWEEVLLMLPALSRNGMNFYTPLSTSSAFKAWEATMPFYAQMGARIYPDDGSGTIIDSDEGVAAMKFMANLFTIYGMPLQVESFYNDFRSGRIPAGVSSIASYVQLSYSAPEIAGRWGVAPLPGMKNKNGVVERWSACPTKADCIFEASNKKEAAWAFIQWWLSDEIQRLYTEKLQNMYGQEFLWASANIGVLKELPVPDEHRAAIAAQLNWMQDAPRIPGGYYTEREVSNAFNRIIYDGMDVRSSIDEASVVTDREIRRKMEEFGYIDADGNRIRDYVVPTIAQVEAWLQ